MKQTLAIIDGDSLCYLSSKGTIQESISNIDSRISDILTKTNCTHYYLFLSEGRYFRYDVNADYKASRSGSASPLLYLKTLKQYLKEQYYGESWKNVEADDAVAYIKKMGAPIVIKADGLAAGKGVVVAMTEKEAIDAVHNMLDDHQFGDASASVVIEEFMEGEEASFIVMSDTENALPMATSQDHKRVGDGDTGPNTGGMGAYSPAPVVTDAVYKRVMDEIINPTLKGMKEDGIPYRGFLYAGLMIDKNGAPRVVEFNCRFGDPETQPIMLRMQSDLVDLCLKACKNGGLNGVDIKYDPRPAIGIVLAAHGYPASPRKGDKITGLEIKTGDDLKVFEAGTKQVGDNIVTSGGRVLCVTALGDDVAKAREKAYAHIKNIHFDGMFYRNDIAWRALNRK